MTGADPGAVTRLVCKRASGNPGAGRPTDPAPAGPDPADIRREVEVLSRCEVPGIVRLVGFGEHPAPWLETRDAGTRTMASPPWSAADRLAALAALTRVLANLHRLGWVHLSLALDHVIWRAPAEGTGGPDRSGADLEVTLCSLGSAVCPAGPAERAADREALAAIMASTIIAPGTEAFRPDLRSALAALVVDLRSGDLDDLDAVVAGLDDLVDAARRSTHPERAEDRSPQPDRRERNGPRRLGSPVRRLPSRPVARVGLVAALVVLLLGGLTAIAAATGSADRHAPPRAVRCARPAVPPPRVDPDGSGCGKAARYRSSVLTVGVERWRLGADIIDGRLVDLDDDGWSELAALRDDGEVFLVRRFPVDAGERVQVRSVATAPGARRLVERSPGIGLDGLRALDADGTPRPLLPVSNRPGFTASPRARDGS